MTNFQDRLRSFFADADATLKGRDESVYVMDQNLEPVRDVVRMKAASNWFSKLFKEVNAMNSLTVTVIREGGSFRIYAQAASKGHQSSTELSLFVNQRLNQTMTDFKMNLSDLFRIANVCPTNSVNQRSITINRANINDDDYAPSIAQASFARWNNNVEDADFRMVA